jgi:hypothetical protein
LSALCRIIPRGRSRGPAHTRCRRKPAGGSPAGAKQYTFCKRTQSHGPARRRQKKNPPPSPCKNPFFVVPFPAGRGWSEGR